jgi:PiT family inorganic phosphate transporter
VNQVFRRGQFVSAAMYSLGHGGNDAQKTMGVIVALLIAAGSLAPGTQLSLTDPHTLWIIISAHAAMGLGTALGGWRIVRTMGMKITKLQPYGGFCAETAGAATLFIATNLGIPVSTTHTITGAIVGVGSTRRLTAVKWGVTRRVLMAWVVTIPASAAVSAATFWALWALHGAALR